MILQIRKVGAAEIAELREIGIRSYLPHYTHLWKKGGLEWYMQRCFSEEALRNDFSNSNVEYYVASELNQDVGFLKLILQKPLPNSDVENALYLEKIYFVKEWTGQGVGRKLMQIAFDRALELKRDCVWLMAMDTSDKPIEAYKKAGFLIHSQTRLDFELMKEQFRGMVVMKKCLEAN